MKVCQHVFGLLFYGLMPVNWRGLFRNLLTEQLHSCGELAALVCLDLPETL